MSFSFWNKVIISGLLVLTACNKPQNYTWVVSTDDNRWVQKSAPVVAVDGNHIDESFDIYPEKTHQEIFGFGGCFNELGWDALQLVEPEIQDSIMQAFFEPGNGFNFNICRMPIGANDYARSWYSLNDTPGDFAMEHFNIERDKTTLIPYIKMAMEYNPQLKVWGSPWCPPAWMKTNNHYACRPDVVNDLTPEGAGQEGVTQFIMEEPYLKAYADYFVKYVDNYRDQGIDVYAVHVQNEPNSCQNFPSCIWTPEELAIFMGIYLGPALDSNFPDLELWYGTVERPFIEHVDVVLQDKEASKYIDGVGFQWAGKEAIPKVNEKYPEMDLMQTETECGDGSNDWSAAEYTWNLIKHYLNNGANSYLYWNLILNETGKSQWGWKQNSLITVNSETKEVTFNPEYHLFKHLTHFVGAGSHKLETSDEDILAFKTPDDKVVIIYVNESPDNKVVSFNVGEKSVSIVAEGKSFNSLEI
ncbi:MAG: glycoside hydrolase family 30 protein [Bacteroidota bacterium]